MYKNHRETKENMQIYKSHLNILIPKKSTEIQNKQTNINISDSSLRLDFKAITIICSLDLFLQLCYVPCQKIKPIWKYGKIAY